MEWEKDLSRAQRANLAKVKASPHYQSMLDDGFIPFTSDWRRENLRRAHLIARQTNPEIKKRRAAQARDRYWSNIDEERRKNNELKSKQRKRRRNEINAKNRQHYARNRAASAKAQKLRRYKREPHRELRAAASLYYAGRINYEQYVESFSRVIRRAAEIEQCQNRKCGRPGAPGGTNKGGRCRYKK